MRRMLSALSFITIINVLLNLYICLFILVIGINPLVPRVQKIKLRNLTLNRLLIVEFVKKVVYLGAHYNERQGLMG